MSLAENRHARHDYSILETFEAGLSLSGNEVKSVRKGQISLKGAFVTIHGSALVLTNCMISPYAQAHKDSRHEDENRSRQLLMKKPQVKYLTGKIRAEGLTVVPLSVYTKGRWIKVSIALARGKKSYDQRDDIKLREAKRDMGRRMRDR